MVENEDKHAVDEQVGNDVLVVVELLVLVESDEEVAHPEIEQVVRYVREVCDDHEDIDTDEDEVDEVIQVAVVDHDLMGEVIDEREVDVMQLTVDEVDEGRVLQQILVHELVE